MYLPKYGSKRIQDSKQQTFFNSDIYYFYSNKNLKFQLNCTAMKDYNIDKWADSSGLPQFNSGYVINNNFIEIFNYGDISTDWKFRIRKEAGVNIDILFEEITSNNTFHLKFDESKLLSEKIIQSFDSTPGYIIIDTSKNSIVFESDWGSEYNVSAFFLLESGSLFNLQPGHNKISVSGGVTNPNGNSSTNGTDLIDKIEYNYLYF